MLYLLLCVLDDVTTTTAPTYMYMCKPLLPSPQRNPTHLSYFISIESIGTHGPQVVEYGDGVVKCQELFLVVLEYGYGIAKENFAPFK